MTLTQIMTRDFPFMALLFLASASAAWAAAPEPVRHPANGSIFRPTGVDFARPVYQTDFTDPKELDDWAREGGESARIEDGRLILDSKPGSDLELRHTNPREFERLNRDHMVFWLKRDLPASFLLEVVLRPLDKRCGLNIVFFSARGVKGESIFDPALAARDGTFVQYTRGDINSYHVSYWASPRGTVHLRKNQNQGFHLVAASDLNPIADFPAETFDTLRIYKRGNKLRIMINNRIAVAWDDDGMTFGPVIRQSGWIGLRQMGYTIRTEYDRLAVYPLDESK
jgi:hypothetical protein